MTFVFFLKILVLKAVCYLNSYGKDFKGGLFRFQSGEPATIAPSAGVSMFFFHLAQWLLSWMMSLVS